MSIIKFIEKLFKNFLPTPFTIAIFLTLIIIVLALILTGTSFNKIIIGWENGLWNSPLLSFTTQMMLMLVLGHSVALSKLASSCISIITKFCNSTISSAAIVSFFSIIVSLFNWGLGLIFGAILARKVGENSIKKNYTINYPLIGAAGYCGLMVWHGGMSGSAPLKIAEKNHFNDIISNEKLLHVLPENIDFSATIFSSMNIFTSLLLIIFIPILFMIIGKISKNEKKITLKAFSINTDDDNKKTDFLAERLDKSDFLGTLIGGLILLLSVNKIFLAASLDFINPNYINLTLLGLALFLHKNIYSFLKSIKIGIQGVAGILIQFPLYFGIMGIMTSSGLVYVFSDFFVTVSNEVTYPIYTMISAGIVNVFVPSGGGQWAVQGPIILQAAYELGVSFEKTIMALVYGDQLTNMLQPFWALPLLGITGLKAREILPYTLLVMVVGFFIFLIGIILF